MKGGPDRYLSLWWISYRGGGADLLRCFLITLNALKRATGLINGHVVPSGESSDEVIGGD